MGPPYVLLNAATTGYDGENGLYAPKSLPSLMTFCREARRRGRYFVAGRNSLIPVNGFRCFAAGVITLDVDASSVLVFNFRRYCEPFKAAFFKPTSCSLLTPPPMELPRPMIKPRLVSGIPEALSVNGFGSMQGTRHFKSPSWC